MYLDYSVELMPIMSACALAAQCSPCLRVSRSLNGAPHLLAVSRRSPGPRSPFQPDDGRFGEYRLSSVAVCAVCPVAGSAATSVTRSAGAGTAKIATFPTPRSTACVSCQGQSRRAPPRLAGRHGQESAASAERFYVRGTGGPLVQTEVNRARA
jgi:hypothetical protein